MEEKSVGTRLCGANAMILNDGFTPGYALRAMPYDEQDSGWLFFSGTEDDVFLSDWHNLLSCTLQEILTMDPSVASILLSNDRNTSTAPDAGTGIQPVIA